MAGQAVPFLPLCLAQGLTRGTLTGTTQPAGLGRGDGCNEQEHNCTVTLCRLLASLNR